VITLLIAGYWWLILQFRHDLYGKRRRIWLCGIKRFLGWTGTVTHCCSGLLLSFYCFVFALIPTMSYAHTTLLITRYHGVTIIAGTVWSGASLPFLHLALLNHVPCVSSCPSLCRPDKVASGCPAICTSRFGPLS